RIDGREHVDAALSHRRGAVVVWPHAGNTAFLLARLAHSFPDVTIVPPADDAEATAWWPGRRAAMARREALERLPAKFHRPLDPPRSLWRALGRNGLVVVAFDSPDGG